MVQIQGVGSFSMEEFDQGLEAALELQRQGQANARMIMQNVTQLKLHKDELDQRMREMGLRRELGEAQIGVQEERTDVMRDRTGVMQERTDAMGRQVDEMAKLRNRLATLEEERFGFTRDTVFPHQRGLGERGMSLKEMLGEGELGIRERDQQIRESRDIRESRLFEEATLPGAKTSADLSAERLQQMKDIFPVTKEGAEAGVEATRVSTEATRAGAGLTEERGKATAGGEARAQEMHDLTKDMTAGMLSAQLETSVTNLEMIKEQLEDFRLTAPERHAQLIANINATQTAIQKSLMTIGPEAELLRAKARGETATAKLTEEATGTGPGGARARKFALNVKEGMLWQPQIQQKVQKFNLEGQLEELEGMTWKNSDMFGPRHDQMNFKEFNKKMDNILESSQLDTGAKPDAVRAILKKDYSDRIRDIFKEVMRIDAHGRIVPKLSGYARPVGRVGTGLYDITPTDPIISPEQMADALELLEKFGISPDEVLEQEEQVEGPPPPGGTKAGPYRVKATRHGYKEVE